MRSSGVTRARLDLKIDAGLKKWAMAYASKKGTTVTDVICEQLERIRQAESKKQPGDVVEQF